MNTDKKISLYTYREHGDNQYQVLDAMGFDPIGEFLTQDKAKVYCDEANKLAISMQLLEIDSAEDFYILISQFYSNHQRKLAKALFDGISQRHQEDCVGYLGALLHYDAADNDELSELDYMLLYLKG